MEKEHSKYTALENKDNGSEIRRFSLFSYDNLKGEALSQNSGEYIKTLSNLSGKDENYLINEINRHQKLI